MNTLEIKAAKAELQSALDDLAIANQAAKAASESVARARDRLRDAQIKADAAMPQCRMVNVHKGKETESRSVVIVRQTPKGAIVVRNVGDADAVTYRFKRSKHTGIFCLDARRWISGSLELRDVPEQYLNHGVS